MGMLPFLGSIFYFSTWLNLVVKPCQPAKSLYQEIRQYASTIINRQHLMSTDTAGHLFALDYISTSKWHEYCNVESDFITYKFDERRYCMFIGDHVLQKSCAVWRMSTFEVHKSNLVISPKHATAFIEFFSSVVIFQILLMLNNIIHCGFFSATVNFPDYNNALWLFVQLPPCLSCGTFSGRLYEARLWMSSGGTASRLHSHEDHDLHCVLFGRKDFIIIDEKYKDNFQYQENVHRIKFSLIYNLYLNVSNFTLHHFRSFKSLMFKEDQL